MKENNEPNQTGATSSENSFSKKVLELKGTIDEVSLRNLTIFNEMKEAELIYGGEFGAARFDAFYVYNKYWKVAGKNVTPVTREEWNKGFESEKMFLRGRRR